MEHFDKGKDRWISGTYGLTGNLKSERHRGRSLHYVVLYINVSICGGELCSPNCFRTAPFFINSQKIQQPQITLQNSPEGNQEVYDFFRFDRTYLSFWSLCRFFCVFFFLLSLFLAITNFLPVFNAKAYYFHNSGAKFRCSRLLWPNKWTKTADFEVKSWRGYPAGPFMLISRLSFFRAYKNHTGLIVVMGLTASIINRDTLLL
jgi:hypothetical protein